MKNPATETMPSGQLLGGQSQTLSVCTVTQNCAHKLVHAIESVLAVADEIIVVDGGSLDNTEEVAYSFEKVRYYF